MSASASGSSERDLFHVQFGFCELGTHYLAKAACSGECTVLTARRALRSWLVQVHYRARAVTFALAFVATGFQIYGKEFDSIAWTALALLFLVYPHFQYWRACASPNPVRSELRNLSVDSVLLGLYVAAIQFSLWLSFAAILANLINSVANKGWWGVPQSVLGLLAGILVWTSIYGLQISLHTEWPAVVICILGVVGYVLVLINIGFRRNIQLRDIKKRQRVILEGVQSGVISMSENGIIESFNQSAEHMFGYGETEVLGRSILILMQDPSQYVNESAPDGDLYSCVRKAIGSPCEAMGRRKDGSGFDLELRVYETLLNDRRLLICTASDISSHKQAQAELRVAATAFESLESMIVTDADQIILKVNKAFTHITGYEPSEVVGNTPQMLRSERHSDSYFRAMWGRVNRDKYWQGEMWCRRKNGEVFPLWLAITAVLDEKGATTNYVGVFSDITEHKVAQDRIEHLAFSDSLTDLPNRRLLMDRLHQALTTSARIGRCGAVLLIDLDDFKTLNDTLGHDKGDLLLQQVAQRLTSCVRESDTVARLGGDEFVVMLEGLSEYTEGAASQVDILGEKILVALNQPYTLANTQIRSTPSVGVAVFNGQQVSAEELLKRADLAMYQSKAAGRNTLRFFDPVMQAVVTSRAALEIELREAVSQQQFVLYYQAQVDSEGRIVGAEALVRWRHPVRGMVSPAEFIPLAEETGLILPLGTWVLDTACAQLADWANRPDMAHLSIAVNVSARQIRNKNFVSEVMNALGHSGANPHKLKMELTESLMVDGVEETIEKMNALRAIGVTFSLDDFGTGYSSLAYLKRLPLSQLKIDQSFVRDILTDPNDAAICRTVIALAQSLGLTSIAEGVETEEHRDALARLGCQAYQGYWFSKPLTQDAFAAYVTQFDGSPLAAGNRA
ncbi:EAL domain-containing protein [Rhodoferax sp. GW822-FHT02A01]|uniref:EAL domain-containing protein n=1 Tax=Rhodoferax sp. GW822-FHT02A01 TaxID=3141537 RepID=UPI00315D476E